MIPSGALQPAFGLAASVLGRPQPALKDSASVARTDEASAVFRIDFFRDVLAELARAIADGARVRAFHASSLLDNFEWTDSYSQGYGLTWVDFRDQKRTEKDSDHWYGRLAAATGSARNCSRLNRVFDGSKGSLGPSKPLAASALQCGFSTISKGLE